MNTLFTDDQIIAKIKEQEAGAKTDNVCRKHGISSATFVTGFNDRFGDMSCNAATAMPQMQDYSA